MFGPDLSLSGIVDDVSEVCVTTRRWVSACQMNVEVYDLKCQKRSVNDMIFASNGVLVFVFDALYGYRS